MGICDSSRLTAEALSAQFESLLQIARDRTVRGGQLATPRRAGTIVPSVRRGTCPRGAGEDRAEEEARHVRAGFPPDPARCAPGANMTGRSQAARDVCGPWRATSRLTGQPPPGGAGADRGGGAAPWNCEAPRGESQTPPCPKRDSTAGGGAYQSRPISSPAGFCPCTQQNGVLFLCTSACGVVVIGCAVVDTLNTQAEGALQEAVGKAVAYGESKGARVLVEQLAAAPPAATVGGHQ